MAMRRNSPETLIVGARPQASGRRISLLVSNVGVIPSRSCLVFSNTPSFFPKTAGCRCVSANGAYKLGALPPSRNSALLHFRRSLKKRAKASNETSPSDIANTTVWASLEPTPLRAFRDVLLWSKRGWTLPLITRAGLGCEVRTQPLLEIGDWSRASSRAVHHSVRRRISVFVGATLEHPSIARLAGGNSALPKIHTRTPHLCRNSTPTR